MVKVCGEMFKEASDCANSNVSARFTRKTIFWREQNWQCNGP
eukprot:CAMPEP_0171541066 /NCGR_PEP_ID=MMETSP0960-20121227/1555_1 /TAXON_ID=87120 /ORGANISM="Aurantiochytrium limacinum, Strain ATCCMYA-1381" /LENGTH=41 /DNA_ID= /DNA_START= /DNA_END= /DNA_ORIENTATION=